ncbi:xylulokinase [Cetobacterium sp. 8H]|uniref:xylulokinase n=1 Tax=Cetobacterium sp. 8H TaxID=2759681 RepID=UPI00163C0170|nr:xylulokinase [Cetobacterium sp. 8H]MBC2851763.1 xylulokinase [Cetobacterium sp. 8H]
MYLGIDLGTSSVKLLLMDKKGVVKKTVSKDYPITYLNDNWAEQNPEDWWNATLQGIKQILKDENRSCLNGISFSGQMHGLVILDKNDEVIRPAILWCDQRTEEECKELNSLEWLYDVTGNQALTGFTAPKILWIKKNEPNNFKKINKIMLPKDYIAYKLSGIHGIDASDASGTLILNVEKRKWSKEVIEFLNIDEKYLGKVFESYEVIGKIKENISNELEISKEVKIIMGGGDQAVGAVGVGAIEEGIISLALGTSGVIFSPSKRYLRDENCRLHSFCDSTGKYHQMGVILSASGAFKWWVEEVNSSKNYEEFNKMADEIKAGSEGLYFLPYLIGERTPHNDSNAKGSFIGLSLNHGKNHMTRSVMEGVAYALRDSFELLKDMGIDCEKIRVSGGGARSQVWKQIFADVLNKDIITINTAEGPALGAAILASVGSGEYKSVEEACEKIIKEVEVTKPCLENVKIYEKNYNIFKEIYPALKKIYKKI